MQTFGKDYVEDGLFRSSRLDSSKIVWGIYKTTTGLLLILFGLLIIGFLLFPVLPELIVFRSYILRFSPYNIGYNSTIQLLVKVLQPAYDLGNDEIDSQNDAQTIEKVEPGTKTADLEIQGTILDINSVNINGKVVDDLSAEAMFRGFWHYPLSAVPGKRGNTVIFGHRFDKLPPSTETFFNLDKILVGDGILISQNNSEFTYTVVKIKIVEKDDVAILKNKGDYRLTLITCTPLWTSEKRLAIIAIQDRVASVI
ncbi:MAG: sortase [Patescibacteria group bacterium]|nr:sortase [Patescibacteria group bacterium]